MHNFNVDEKFIALLPNFPKRVPRLPKIHFVARRVRRACVWARRGVSREPLSRPLASACRTSLSRISCPCRADRAGEQGGVD